MRSSPRGRWLLLAQIASFTTVLVGLSLVACQERQPGDSPSATESGASVQVPATGTPTDSAATPGVRVETVRALGLSFQLPNSFGALEDNGGVLVANSLDPQAVFSVDQAPPSVIDHKPKGGESLAPADVGGPEAVVVTNAAVEGLPPGIEVRELLVSNGSRSFSMILSAGEPDLSAMWDPLLASVEIEGG